MVNLLENPGFEELIPNMSDWLIGKDEVIDVNYIWGTNPLTGLRSARLECTKIYYDPDTGTNAHAAGFWHQAISDKVKAGGRYRTKVRYMGTAELAPPGYNGLWIRIAFFDAEYHWISGEYIFLPNSPDGYTDSGWTEFEVPINCVISRFDLAIAGLGYIDFDDVILEETEPPEPRGQFHITSALDGVIVTNAYVRIVDPSTGSLVTYGHTEFTTELLPLATYLIDGDYGDYHAGPLSVTLEFEGQIKDIILAFTSTQPPPSPCIIATVSYGESAKLDTIRGFRDNFMLRTGIGYFLIHSYYTIGKFIAPKLIGLRLTKRIMRGYLDVVILTFVRKLRGR